MWSNQLELKPLPVPKISETLGTFIESIKALIDENTESLEEVMEMCENFPAEAKELQDLLEKRGLDTSRNAFKVIEDNKLYANNVLKQDSLSQHPDSLPYPNTHWLESYWESLAYLSFDETLLWTNVFQTGFNSQPVLNKDEDLNRAAGIVCGFMEFRHHLLKGSLSMEPGARGKYLCNAQNLRIISTTRIPGSAQDRLVTDHFSFKHIAVQCNGYWYEVQVLKDAKDLSSATGAENIIKIEILEDILKIIRHDARLRKANKSPIATLTTMDRRDWYKARLSVLATNESNATSLRSIESAIFHLVLSETDDVPKTHAQAQKGLIFANNGTEVWCDKSIAWVHFKNGVGGVHIEHSAADAVVPSRIALWAEAYTHMFCKKGSGFNNFSEAELKEIFKIIHTDKNIDPETFHKESQWEPEYYFKLLEEHHESKHLKNVQQWNEFKDSEGLHHLDFYVDPTIESLIEAQKLKVLDIKIENQLSVLNIPKEMIGTGKMIMSSKVPPDSFMQMCLQLAFYRDQQTIPATYETAMTRSFLHGRTETIRTQSEFSKYFVENFDNNFVSSKLKLEALNNAVKYHRNYTKKCMIGKGIDRHLLILKMLAYDNKLPMPTLLQSKIYAKSSDFNLSTSQMPWGFPCVPGFSAPAQESYGTCYRFRGDGGIIATVVCRGSNKSNKNADRFMITLKKSIADVAEFLEQQVEGANFSSTANLLSKL